ncbi:unnamed protein product, partial [Urochloa humidicola]
MFPNDGSQGGFPGGNNAPFPPALYPYMYGYQVPPYVPHQGFQQFQSNVPLMHPTTSAAHTVLPSAEMGEAFVENDAEDVYEVPLQESTRKGKKKKAGTKVKLGNFNPNEDVILVRSYAEISDDPITNTGQRKDRFWLRITERYNSERGRNPERSLRSLSSRFEVISKDVSKFASYHAGVVRDNPSGMTDADKTTHAAARFAGGMKRNFQYLHCWEI